MKLTKTLMVLAMAIGFAACGPNGGQMNTTTNTTGTGGTPDAGAPTPLAARLVGTWRYTGGQMSCTCDDGSTVSASADGTETERFSPGITADQVIATDDGGCALTCDIAGNTVECQAATCEYDGARVAVSADVYTAAGNELHERVDAVVAIEGGRTCQCTQTGVLVRAE